MQGKIELIKKGFGKIIMGNKESSIVSLPMEVENEDIAEVEFVDRNLEKFKKFVAYSPKKYYGSVISNFKNGGIILVTYPDLLGTVIFKNIEYQKGSKVEFRLKKTFEGMEAVEINLTKEFYKCFLPSFGKIKKIILKPKYGVVEDVVIKEKNVIEGEIKSFGNKGFGFIRSLEGDIFFYGNVFEKVYNKTPNRGDKVIVKFKNTSRGKIAVSFYNQLPKLSKNKQYFILDGKKLPITEYEKFYKKIPEIGDMVYYIEDKGILFRNDDNEIEKYVFVKDEKENYTKGIINFVNENKKYGFIKSKNNSIFFSFYSFEKVYHKNPKKGEEVKFIYTETEKGLSVKRFIENEFEVRKDSFNNFVDIDENSYYYAYINKNKIEEIFKYNKEDLSLSIACYKQSNDDLTKLEAIDCIIKNDFESKNIKKKTLLKEKIEVLDKLINKNINNPLGFEYEVEYQKLNFNPDRLKKFNFKGIEFISLNAINEYKQNDNKIEFINCPDIKKYKEKENIIIFDKIKDNDIKKYQEKEKKWEIIQKENK